VPLFFVLLPTVFSISLSAILIIWLHLLPVGLAVVAAMTLMMRQANYIQFALASPFHPHSFLALSVVVLVVAVVVAAMLLLSSWQVVS